MAVHEELQNKYYNLKKRVREEEMDLRYGVTVPTEQWDIVRRVEECLSQRLKERGHTPEDINNRLLSVRKYLAEKISDINRTKTSGLCSQPQ
ncbi:hypothetical protein IRJ41_016588 [Triplophysa rosa]|uniref:Uncharacterized protein n=1 Tax=Triplophysa rosa TaxID=992332 RepID=A0A9W7WZ88_TRIRA|nr:hypothetical protein IRJ41_016588 [Triplophysa rosa]